MLTVTIDRNLGEPVYEQVARQIRLLVASGDLRPGTVLPPVRRLAGELGVNLNTIARAYRLLEREGFLDIRRGAGVRVAAPAAEAEHQTRTRLIEDIRASLARLRQAGVGADEVLELVQREMLAFDGGQEG